jgi:hypothetical protein
MSIQTSLAFPFVHSSVTSRTSGFVIRFVENGGCCWHPSVAVCCNWAVSSWDQVREEHPQATAENVLARFRPQHSFVQGLANMWEGWTFRYPRLAAQSGATHGTDGRRWWETGKTDCGGWAQNCETHISRTGQWGSVYRIMEQLGYVKSYCSF